MWGKRFLTQTTGLIVALAAWVFAPPAPALNVGGEGPPVMKWLQGETRPSSSPAKAGDLTTTPSLVAAPRTAAAPKVSVTSRLGANRLEYHVGEDIELLIELSWDGAVDEVVPESPDEPILNNLAKKPGGLTQSNVVQPDASPQRVVVTYHYVLEPIKEGPASIEPVTVFYRVKGATDRLQLTTDRYSLQISARPFPWGKVVGGVLACAAVFVAVSALVIGGRARARRAREAAVAARPPSLFEVLREQLDGIRGQFRDGAIREGYDAVDGFVRSAVGGRLGAELHAVTIDELMTRLEGSNMNPAIRDRAVSILDRCGQVKFAGYSPTVADQDQVIADCRLLLDDLDGETPSAQSKDAGKTERKK